MRKIFIASGTVAFILTGLLLPSLAHQGGRKVTTQTITESCDFVRAGAHVLNRSHIAYVASNSNRTTVYFVGNVPPIVLSDNGESLVAQLVSDGDSNHPPVDLRPLDPSPPPEPSLAIPPAHKPTKSE